MCVVFKNLTFLSLCCQHDLHPFYLDNIEGKHRRLALCCLALGRYINPGSGVASKQTPLTYKFFADKNIITNDVKQYPEGLTFLDELESVLLGQKSSAVLSECSAVEVYYISTLPSVVSTNDVLNVAQALSKQISESKIASNCPYPIDLCARFVNALIPDVSV